jgi:uncharacterized phage-associated protein
VRPTAVASSFEVAFWFLDRAVSDGEYLQPQKLQRLMFLAQAYFGVLQGGVKLMPATFVVTDDGPIEPTVFKAFARGRPAVDLSPIEEVPRHVLDSVWRQFGAHSADHLTKLVKRHAPYLDALSAGLGAEITFESMVEFYSTEGLSRRKGGGAPTGDVTAIGVPAAEKVLRPKVLRNHSGKPVSATRWMPKRVD